MHSGVLERGVSAIDDDSLIGKRKGVARQGGSEGTALVVRPREQGI